MECRYSRLATIFRTTAFAALSEAPLDQSRAATGAGAGKRVEARLASSLVQQVEALRGCFSGDAFLSGCLPLLAAASTSSATIRPWGPLPFEGTQINFQFLRQLPAGVDYSSISLFAPFGDQPPLSESGVSTVAERYPPSALEVVTFWTGLGSAARVGLLLCSFYFGFRFCYQGNRRTNRSSFTSWNEDGGNIAPRERTLHPYLPYLTLQSPLFHLFHFVTG